MGPGLYRQSQCQQNREKKPKRPLTFWHYTPRPISLPNPLTKDHNIMLEEDKAQGSQVGRGERLQYIFRKTVSHDVPPSSLDKVAEPSLEAWWWGRRHDRGDAR